MMPTSFSMKWILTPIALVGSQVHGAEISSDASDDDVVIITIVGEIGRGDAENFRREAAKHQNAIVALESDGGSTIEAIEIGEAIRLRGFSTLVLNGSQCVSACGLIWLAGTPRVLSESARVGFHATYSDEAGQKLESGVGNALVGRYFTLLNLPMKAIVFATEASPHELNWLEQSNYLNAGIEIKFIDDYSSDEPDGDDPPPPAPPPIRTQRIEPQSETRIWDTVGSWNIVVDRTLGDACFVLSEFEDDTVLRIGLDRRTPGQSYVMVANASWKSLVLGEEHPMKFQFDGESPWEATSEVIEVSGVKALSTPFKDNAFWAEFASSDELSIYAGARPVAMLSLDGSGKALDSLIACQKYWNGRDPFAK